MQQRLCAWKRENLVPPLMGAMPTGLRTGPWRRGLIGDQTKIGVSDKDAKLETWNTSPRSWLLSLWNWPWTLFQLKRCALWRELGELHELQVPAEKREQMGSVRNWKMDGNEVFKVNLIISRRNFYYQRNREASRRWRLEEVFSPLRLPMFRFAYQVGDQPLTLVNVIPQIYRVCQGTPPLMK